MSRSRTGSANALKRRAEESSGFVDVVFIRLNEYTPHEPWGQDADRAASLSGSSAAILASFYFERPGRLIRPVATLGDHRSATVLASSRAFSERWSLGRLVLQR